LRVKYISSTSELKLAMNALHGIGDKDRRKVKQRRF